MATHTSREREPTKVLSEFNQLESKVVACIATSSFPSHYNGLIAAVKHFINNEQEHFRETSSSNVDDR